MLRNNISYVIIFFIWFSTCNIPIMYEIRKTNEPNDLIIIKKKKIGQFTSHGGQVVS